VFNYDDVICIYDSQNESFIYEANGGVNTLLNNHNKLYYLRWSKDTVNNYASEVSKAVQCKLIEYNYKTNTDTILYTESDINKRPYHWGPDFRYLTKIEFKNRNDSLFATYLYYQPDTTNDYGEYCKELNEVFLDL